MEHVIIPHETGAATSSDAGNIGLPPARVGGHGTPAVKFVAVNQRIVVQTLTSYLEGLPK